jgi:hypothetical protein
MKKELLLKNIYSMLYELKSSFNLDKSNKEIKDKILNLEMEIEKILLANFKEIDETDISTSLEEIKDKSNLAKENFKQTIKTRSKILKTISYLNEIINAIKEIQKII